MAVRLLETVVGVDEGAMPAEGDRVSCRYVAMSRECNTRSAWADRLTDDRCCELGNSRRHLWPRYDDDAIRNPKEGCTCSVKTFLLILSPFRSTD